MWLTSKAAWMIPALWCEDCCLLGVVDNQIKCGAAWWPTVRQGKVKASEAEAIFILPDHVSQPFAPIIFCQSIPHIATNTVLWSCSCSFSQSQAAELADHSLLQSLDSAVITDLESLLAAKSLSNFSEAQFYIGLLQPGSMVSRSDSQYCSRMLLSVLVRRTHLIWSLSQWAIALHQTISRAHSDHFPCTQWPICAGSLSVGWKPEQHAMCLCRDT